MFMWTVHFRESSVFIRLAPSSMVQKALDTSQQYTASHSHRFYADRHCLNSQLRELPRQLRTLAQFCVRTFTYLMIMEGARHICTSNTQVFLYLNLNCDILNFCKVAYWSPINISQFNLQKLIVVVSLFFCPFVLYCFTSTVSSTPSFFRQGRGRAKKHGFKGCGSLKKFNKTTNPLPK